MAEDSDRATEALRRQVSGLTLPRHIAIIMDGNGRWAQQRGLPRSQGHLEGRRATERCVRACVAINLEVLSLYAFSVENWHRSPSEVAAILDLLEYALREETQALHEANIRFRASGRLHQLPDSLRSCLQEAEEQMAGNTGMVLNLCVNYGGRAEIVDAVRALAVGAVAGQLSPEDVDEDAVRRHLYQPDLPDPDVLLRPGGEQRISNFLLWEMAYTEIIVMSVLWPDFREEHLGEALVEFSRRQRRYGGVPTDDEG